MAKRKISKKQYERAKQIVSEYEAQFALSLVRGTFKASDIEYSHSSFGVPKIKDMMLSDTQMIGLQHLFDVMEIPVWEVNTDDYGYLFCGKDSRYDYRKHELHILKALNNL